MLPVQLGNYFQKKETEQANYQWNKPLIKLLSRAFLWFGFTGMLVSVATYFCVTLLKPEQICNQEYLDKALKLVNSAKQLTTMASQTRPNNISVCKVVQTFVEKIPANLVVNDIVIRPEQYVIKGTTPVIDEAYDYVKTLDFGPLAEANLSTLQNGAGSYTWTIDVTFKKKGKK